MSLVLGLAGIVAIVKLVIKWFKSKLPISEITKQKLDIENTPAHRFIKLFESHGISRTQISGFFGHDLTILDCSSPEKLIEKLTDEMLQDAANLFAINIDWLHCVSDEIYKIHDFYKSPQSFSSFIKKLKDTDNTLSGYVLFPEQSSKRYLHNSAIVICESIGELNGKEVQRLHISGGWSHSYWKCRGYQTACISIALNNEIWLFGEYCKHDFLAKFSRGELLPDLDTELDRYCFESFKRWSVDELVENPDVYIKDIDPEQDNFGIQSAIKLWLQLENQNYIELKEYKSDTQVRDSFLNFKVS